MIEIRCVKCNRLLMKSNGDGQNGLQVEVKCSKCGFIGTYSLGKIIIKDFSLGSTIKVAEIKEDVTILDIR